MAIRPLFALVLCAGIAAGCSSAPLRCPTDAQWGKRSVFKNDHKSIDIQGTFDNDPGKFLKAAAQLKDGLSKEETMRLGFTTDSATAHPCDDVGWIDASQLILGNSLITEPSIEQAMKSKQRYSAIRCHAKSLQIRTDRELSYINNFDTCGRGVDILLTIIFRKSDRGIDQVTGVDLNRTPIKSEDRQSSFLRVFGDMISPPKISLDQTLKIP